MGLNITSTSGLSKALEKPGDRVFISVKEGAITYSNEHSKDCDCIVYIDNETGNPQVLPLNPILLNGSKVSVLTGLSGNNNINIQGHELTLEASTFPEPDHNSLPIPACAVAAMSNSIPEGAIEFHLEKDRNGLLVTPDIILSPGKDFIIGRSGVQGLDLTIDDNSVSRKHCRLFTENDRLYIEDLGSSNGTYVNGKKVSEKTPLKNGDLIKISENKFKIKIKNSILLTEPLPVKNTCTRFSEDGPDKKGFSLEVFDENGISTDKYTFYLSAREGIVISKIDGQIVISDNENSNYFCELMNMGGVIQLFAAGEIPIKVNGEELHIKPLYDGNRIKAGEHALFELHEINNAILDRPTADAPLADLNLKHHELEEPLHGGTAVGNDDRPKALRTMVPLADEIQGTTAPAEVLDPNDKTHFKVSLSSTTSSKLSLDVSAGKPVTIGRDFCQEHPQIFTGNPRRVSGEHLIFHAINGELYLEHIGLYGTTVSRQTPGNKEIIKRSGRTDNEKIKLTGGENIILGNDECSVSFKVGVEKANSTGEDSKSKKRWWEFW